MFALLSRKESHSRRRRRAADNVWEGWILEGSILDQVDVFLAGGEETW